MLQFYSIGMVETGLGSSPTVTTAVGGTLLSIRWIDDGLDLQNSVGLNVDDEVDESGRVRPKLITTAFIIGRHSPQDAKVFSSHGKQRRPRHPFDILRDELGLGRRPWLTPSSPLSNAGG